jgi:hypothetical protein
VVSGAYEIAAGLLERDVVEGQGSQAQRLARAPSNDRDAEKRAIDRWRSEKEWRNR